MLYLLEVTFTNAKETAAIYDNFADETALLAEYESKLGAAMKADAFKAELLVAFAQTGQILAQAYTSKGDEYSLSPRMIWVQVSDGVETADQSKKADMNTLEADYHSKKGSAMKNVDIDAITILGVDGKSVVINDYWSRPIEYVEPQEQGE